MTRSHSLHHFVPRQAIRLLLVEGDPADADSVESALQKGARTFAVSRSGTLAAARQAVATARFDVVVLDLDLPDSRGLDTLTKFQEKVGDTLPIFVLSDTSDKSDIAEIIFHSGNECLPKNYLDHTLLPQLLSQAIAWKYSQISTRQLIASNPDGILVVDFEGVALLANAAAAALFNREPEELIGHAFGFPVVAGSWANIDTLTNRVAEMRAVEIDWNGGIAFLVSLRDVTERQRLLKEMNDLAAQLAEANAELRQFAYITSHDLKTPLRNVVLYLQLLARRYHGQLDQDADAFIDFALTGAQQVTRLLNDLLTYNRLTRDAHAQEHLDLTRVVDGVLAVLHPAILDANAEITVAPLPTLVTDGVQINSLFQNLIGNALKYRDPARPIKIAVDVRREGEFWHFTVTDNGQGIAAEYHEKVFEMFQRLHTQEECEGSGIGLAIVKRIVQHYGGTIWVESTPGIGSVFHFTLPASDGTTQ